MNPLVSIIIPTYNRVHLIGETLDSVLAQTYTNWECIIVDDGSTDMTKEVVQKCYEVDNRFRFYERPKYRLKGASACRNYGLEKSKGKFIQYLDSDDTISINKLWEQINFLKQEKLLTIATSKWGRFSNLKEDVFFYENLVSYDSFYSLQSFLNALVHSKGYFPIHSYLIPRELIEKAGMWNESLKLNDDGEFISRIFVECSNYVYVPNCHVLYRTSTSNNLSSYVDEIEVRKSIEVLKEIEFRLLKFLEIRELSYIKNVKNITYQNLKKFQPRLIFKNCVFFQEQIKNDGLLQLVKLIISYYKVKNEL